MTRKLSILQYSKTCVNGHCQKDWKMVFQTNYRLMQVKIKLPYVIKTYVLSVFEWPFYAGFTVVKQLSLRCKDAV